MIYIIATDMAYYTSRPDSLLDVFQLRYFEVTELLDISNGSQTNRVKFCVARSFFFCMSHCGDIRPSQKAHFGN